MLSPGPNARATHGRRAPASIRRFKHEEHGRRGHVAVLGQYLAGDRAGRRPRARAPSRPTTRCAPRRGESPTTRRRPTSDRAARASRPSMADSCSSIRLGTRGDSVIVKPWLPTVQVMASRESGTRPAPFAARRQCALDPAAPMHSRRGAVGEQAVGDHGVRLRRVLKVQGAQLHRAQQHPRVGGSHERPGDAQRVERPLAAHEADVHPFDLGIQPEARDQRDVHAGSDEPGAGDGDQVRDVGCRHAPPMPARTARPARPAGPSARRSRPCARRSWGPAGRWRPAASRERATAARAPSRRRAAAHPGKPDAAGVRLSADRALRPAGSVPRCGRTAATRNAPLPSGPACTAAPRCRCPESQPRSYECSSCRGRSVQPRDGAGGQPRPRGKQGSERASRSTGAAGSTPRPRTAPAGAARRLESSWSTPRRVRGASGRLLAARGARRRVRHGARTPYPRP